MKKEFSMNQKFFALIMVIAILSTCIPTQMISIAETASQQEFEDFESEMVLVNGIATNQKLLQKNDITQWWFEGGDSNSVLNLATFPTNFIENGDGVNNSKFLSTGTTTLIGTKKTSLIRTLPNPYTNATITHEIRLKKPASGTLRYNLWDSAFNRYSAVTGGKKIAQIAIKGSTGTMTYGSEYKGPSTAPVSTNASLALTSAAPWVYIRFVMNLPQKTMKLYYGTSLDNMLPWNGDANKVYNFQANGSSPSYSMANSTLGALEFSSGTTSEAYQIGCDDVKTYYGAGPSPVATGLSITNDNVVGHTIQGSYSTYSDPRNYAESGSTATWRRADDANFTTNVETIKTESISQGTSSSYKLTTADNNKYIQFSVVPRSSAADFNEGYESSTVLQNKIRMPQTVPTVTLKRPLTATRVYTGDAITMAASAICDDTTITKMEYYANGSLVAQSEAAPFSASWTGAVIGTYSVYAKAYNALNESASSAPISMEVITKPRLADEFDVLREKWKLQLTGGILYDLNDPDINARIAAIDSDAEVNRQYFKDNPGYTSNLDSYSALETMALAYATNGSKYQGNTQLRDEIVAAFTQQSIDAYNTTNSGFFWGWEFGYPTSICDIIAMMYDDLPQSLINTYMTAIDYQNPDVGYTYANKMWDCQAIMLRGVMGKSAAKIIQARDGMKPVYAYTTSGEGFYLDGSFIQHSNIAYNGGYGKSLFREMTRMIALLDGSTWKVTDPNMINVYQIAYDSYAAYIYKGEFMDMTRGREIGSPVSRNSHRIGHQAMHGFIEMTQFAPEPYRTEYKRLIKKWIIEDTYMPFFETDLPLDVLRIAKEIMADDSIQPAEPLIDHIRSAAMARVVHLRPDYAFGLSMTSRMSANYEALDANVNGWYTGAGMTYLYNNDIEQFADHYWETVNRYRLPGITLDTMPRGNDDGHAVLNPFNWVGGTDIDGLYGVSGMYLGQWNSTLQAKKSWFMLDDEIVCLGAGINSTDNRTIESIVENRKIRDDGQNVLTIDGAAQPVKRDWSSTSEGAKWMHLSGNVANSDIGYYFPDPQQIKLLRENRLGSNYGMYEIPSGYDIREPKNYMTMWVDHGANPVDAKYSYALLPDKSSQQVSDYASNPDFTILENSSNVQAIKEKKLNIVAANFWNDGLNKVDMISSDKKASVMTRINNGILEVFVSDPTMSNTGTINLTIDKNTVQTLSLPAGMQVLQAGPALKLQVNVKNSIGKTFTAKFQLDTISEPAPVVINAYYHIPTNTLVDIMITDDVTKPYIPPVVAKPAEYEIKQFTWKDLVNIQPVTTN